MKIQGDFYCEMVKRDSNCTIVSENPHDDNTSIINSGGEEGSITTYTSYNIDSTNKGETDVSENGIVVNNGSDENDHNSGQKRQSKSCTSSWTAK